MDKKNLLKLFRKYNKIISRFNKRFNNSKKEYTKMLKSKDSNFEIENKYLFPCLDDWHDSAGFLGNYFWQDLWAAQHIFKKNPKKHYDIGSRIDGFVSHLASFREVVLIDIRPLSSKIPNVFFIQADATKLDSIDDESIESLSALCSLEHFGLGRYGDPIDPEACFKVFNSIQKKMKSGGKVYISVPVGKEHLEFNAHRIFYPETIIKSFDKMRLIEFSYVSGKKDEIEYNQNIHKYDDDINFGGDNFGLFLFEKI